MEICVLLFGMFDYGDYRKFGNNFHAGTKEQIIHFPLVIQLSEIEQCIRRYKLRLNVHTREQYYK